MKLTYPKIHSRLNLQNYLDNFLLKEIRTLGCVISALDMKESGILWYTITYNGYELGHIQFKYSCANECYITMYLTEELRLNSISHYKKNVCRNTEYYMTSSKTGKDYNDGDCVYALKYLRNLVLSYKTIKIQMKKYSITDMFT